MKNSMQLKGCSSSGRVATAQRLRYPLITADGNIQDGDWVDTVCE
jgi:hypothetical protein